MVKLLLTYITLNLLCGFILYFVKYCQKIIYTLFQEILFKNIKILFKNVNYVFWLA